VIDLVRLRASAPIATMDAHSMLEPSVRPVEEAHRKKLDDLGVRVAASSSSTEPSPAWTIRVIVSAVDATT
jgi:hypothetical protein